MKHLLRNGISLTLGLIAFAGCKHADDESSAKDLRFVSTEGGVEVLFVKDDVVYDKVCATQNADNTCDCPVNREPDSMTLKEYLSHISYGDTGLWPQTLQGQLDLNEAYEAARAEAANNPQAASDAAHLKKYVDNMASVLQLRKGLLQGCINVRSFSQNYEFLLAPFVAKKKAQAADVAADRAIMKQCDVHLYYTDGKSPERLMVGLNTFSAADMAAIGHPMHAVENQVSCYTPPLNKRVGLFILAAAPSCRLLPETGRGNVPTNAQAFVKTTTLNNNTALYFFSPVNDGVLDSTLPTIISNSAPYCYLFKRIPTAEFQ